MKKKLWILAIVVALLGVGECSMNDTKRSSEKIDIQKQMVTHVIQNYNGIDKLVINDFL